MSASAAAAHQWSGPNNKRSPSSTAIQSVNRKRRSLSQRPVRDDPCSIAWAPNMAVNGTTQVS